MKRESALKAARELLDEINVAPREIGKPKTASQRFVRVDCVLPPDVKELLDLVCSDKKRARSRHIERALRFYLMVLGFSGANK
jgi:hypothetical protein